MNPIALNYNSAGTIRLQFPQGPASDSYKISLIVRIIDDSNAVQTYNVSGQVQVLPNVAQTMEIMESMVAVANGDSSSLNTFMQELSSQNLQTTAQNIMSFTSVLNDMSENGINLSSSRCRQIICHTFDISTKKTVRSRVKEAIIGIMNSIFGLISILSVWRMLSRAPAEIAPSFIQIFRTRTKAQCKILTFLDGLNIVQEKSDETNTHWAKAQIDRTENVNLFNQTQ